MVVRENSVVNLTCQAEGWPKPRLRWRRADGEMIKYQGGTGKCECEIVKRFLEISSGSNVGGLSSSDDGGRELSRDPKRHAGPYRKVLLHRQQWNSTNSQ